MVAWQPVGLAVGVYDMYVMHLRHTYCILSDVRNIIMLKTFFSVGVFGIQNRDLSLKPQ